MVITRYEANSLTVLEFSISGNRMEYGYADSEKVVARLFQSLTEYLASLDNFILYNVQVVNNIEPCPFLVVTIDET